MKRLILILLLTLSSFTGYANSFLSLWGGVGYATHYNYDLSFSGGLSYFKAISSRVGLGASLMAQTYNLYYDKESTDLVGATIRHKSMYAFFSPVLDYHLGHRNGNTHFYVTGGVGFNLSASDTMHKFSHVAYSPTGYAYDSAIDGSAKLNKLAFRFALGLTEYFGISSKYRLIITEEFAFLPNPLSSATDETNIQLSRDAAHFYMPSVISLRIGFCRRAGD